MYIYIYTYISFYIFSSSTTTNKSHMQAETQLKLLIKTTKSKLEFKLSKSRSISTNTIQSVILPDLQNLVDLPNDSRSFERSFEILKMKISQLVRNDRTADVWEDIIGELAILENSINKLILMAEFQRDLIIKQQQMEIQNKKKSKNNNWSFLGFEFKNSNNNIDQDTDKLIKDNDNNEPLDRVTKVVRNILVANDNLSDDIKELHKLSLFLNKCINKELVLTKSPDLILYSKNESKNVSKSDDKDKEDKDGKNIETHNVQPLPKLDLEDRIYIEIIRKLRGDDEDTVVNDYLHELCDIYKIDILNQGKYKNDDTSNDDTSNDDETIIKPQIKKKLDDLDDLKQRFEALKKT